MNRPEDEEEEDVILKCNSFVKIKEQILRCYKTQILSAETSDRKLLRSVICLSYFCVPWMRILFIYQMTHTVLVYLYLLIKRESCGQGGKKLLTR